jgi:feruloyl-CoA synthase
MGPVTKRDHDGWDDLGRLDPVLTPRDDGSVLVVSRQTLGDHPRCLTDRLVHWAAAAPDRTFLAERAADGGWRRVSFAETWRTVRRLAAWLLDLDLSADRPIAILSGNDVEHGLLALAAMTVGVPYVPVSPPYSLVARDFGKLDHCMRLLTPGLVYATDAAPFAKALAACAAPGRLLVAARGADGTTVRPLDRLMGDPDDPRIDRALAAVTGDTIAKFLLTSGSTGEPKAVVNTQRMIMANQIMLLQCFPFLAEEPPVFVDWLPWNHTFGSNHNFGLALCNGGTFHIDEGKPVPAGIAATVRNLKEIAPTAYFNVPKGYETLIPHLEADPDFARHVFGRLRFLFYAGAGMAQAVWDALQALSHRATGHGIPIVTGLGATETAPSALMNMRRTDRPANLGHPMIGVTLKLVPVDGKLEARVKAPTVMPGYWRSPDLTAKAFDEEGFYRFGDALTFATPGDPDGGFLFDGRIAEDFKLATGTWVSVVAIRNQLIGGLAPLVRDVVVAGHDRDFVTAIVVADPEHAGRPDLAEAVGARLAALAAAATGSSNRVERVAILPDAPSLEAGEITDKGSLNQRAVLARRAALVDALYAEPPAPPVIVARPGSVP